MEIYEPAEDSELLAKYVKKLARGKVLDVGTGSGIQALTAAKKKSIKGVIAVDINPKAVDFFGKKIKKDKLKKITVKKSNLFSKVKGKFDFVVFNPPYLPQDKGINDPALYGGKKGWEVLEKFFSEVGNYLTSNGQILIVFSSLTNKNKVNEIIKNRLLEFKELGRKKLPMFEELYVYKVWKSDILKKIEKKGISDVNYLTHGKRGDVFVGQLTSRKKKEREERRKVAIKMKRKESKAVKRIKNETKWLKILNKKKIGPKLIASGSDFLITRFVEGEFLPEFLKTKNKKKNKDKKKIKNKTVEKNKKKRILIDILKQCFEMDKLGINKEEMHRPIKHIIINRQYRPVMIDFERCYLAKKPHNVTQFGEFLMRNRLVNKKKMIEMLKNYKKERNKSNFNKILLLIQS